MEAINFLKNTTKWNRTRCKLASLILLLTFLLFYLIQIPCFGSYLIMKTGISNKKLLNDTEYCVLAEFRKEDLEFKGEKLIHFDLKGAPPKISYILNLLSFLKKLGATGILLEYEDTFPYHSELEEITALNAYTPSDVAAIIKTARINNLTVIPLIPTFGHFEFVLKHEKYKELREVEENPQVLCPNHEKVYSVLKKMIDQVLEVHNTSKYLHIGCDEVDFLGLCPKCQKIMKKKKWRKDHLYFEHMKKIAEYITTAHPGVKPIVWSDKFLKQNEKIIAQHGIPNLVDVMFWNYRPEKYNYPSADDMHSYEKMFKDLWIANAFKGATGSTKIITDIHYHLRNTEGWIEFFREWKSELNFKGIALTGWQRYNNFMALCELLPVGIPSLALNLNYLKHSEGIREDEVKEVLNCNGLVPVTLQEIQDAAFLSGLKCDFPGFKIYSKIHYYYIMLLNLKTALKNLERGDLTFYNILHNATNPAHIQELSKGSYNHYLLELNYFEKEIKFVLAKVYDEHTISEWITTHVTPVRLRLQAAINMLNSLSNVRVWPRRPLVSNDLQMKEIFNKICGENETRGCAFFNIHL